MSFKTSLTEYTQEEISENGNGMYGGKRHDEICEYLQNTYKFTNTQINDISMGVWLAIDSERRVHESKRNVDVTNGVVGLSYLCALLSDSKKWDDVCEIAKHNVKKAMGVK